MTNFDPVLRRTVAEDVRERLLHSIETGQFTPGQSLPAERVLSDQFAVSRASIREAVQGLVSLGYVERRSGHMRVAERVPGLELSDDRKRHVRDIFEMRRIIEVPMAALTAARATAQERAEIHECAQKFGDGMPLAQFRTLDREFHWAVARASHNAVVAEVYLKVLDGLFASEQFESLLFNSANSEAVAQIIAESTLAHRAIAEGVVKADATVVSIAVERHLMQVEERMLAQLI